MICSIQKAMNILAILSNEKNNPVPLIEIAARTGYPKPTCSHILETLCHDGYVKRISHSKGYVLGPSLYHLTRYGRYEAEFISLCRPVMRWMEKKSHATVVLSVIHNNQKFIIDNADNEQNLFLEHPTIRIDDIYRTATGRAILAYMDREQVKVIWEKYGKPPAGHWDEILSFESLMNALKDIQQQEIVISVAMAKEGEQNAIGYAYPLFRRTTCIGAVGIAWKPLHSGQMIDPKTEKQLCDILRKGAKEIMRRLSYEDSQ